MIIQMGDYEYNVNSVDYLRDVRDHLKKDQPKWCVVDFETTGLHLKKDLPTIGSFTWKGQSYVFPTTEENLLELVNLANQVGFLVNHNINYDLHMAANKLGDDLYGRRFKKLGDTMGFCRLSFEALSSRYGGDTLKLKEIGNKYIDANADRYEKAVLSWMRKKRTSDRKVLSAMLRPFDWTITRLENAMNKSTEPIPEEIMNVFREWRNAYPEPTYADVPVDVITPYVASDGILTDILIEKSTPVITFRKQWKILNKEFELLPVVWEMERQGIPVDREYLKKSLELVEDYIYELQMKMHDLAGHKFTVGQHKVIKDIYEDRLGYKPSSTDKSFMKKMSAEGDELADTIIKLRRLEKWKATYIERILDVSEYDGKFYSSMNQFNPVSGRFSGDAQQFPRDAIYDDKGNEIYNPRRAFKLRGYYLDFSQVELRVQAHYTMYFGGDTNLCRAYMPFKCVHYETGEIFDHETEHGRNRWNEMKPGAPTDKHWEELLKEGWSAWVIPETGKPWIPTDVHSATTVRALKIMGMNPEEMDEKEFSFWRGKGKQFNFMRNYGGGDFMAAETLDISLDQAKAMNKGYTDAFPKVVTYQRAVESTMNKQGYIENLFGRRYYISSSRNFYRAANYLIQGTCADDLKSKMIQIDKFIKDNNLKLRMVLCVHDELQFHVPDPSEDWAIWEIKKIMEYAPNINIPIIAEVEFSDTYWSEKRKVLSPVK